MIVVAYEFAGARDVLFLGSGPTFSIDMEGSQAEGASYIHAEGYAACKMNQGPIALIGEGMAVIIVAPTGEFCDKTDSILEAAAALGGG